MIQTVQITAPKIGDFFFTLDEWAEMKRMSQLELVKRIEDEFSIDLTRDEVVYVTNHIQIRLIAEVVTNS